MYNKKALLSLLGAPLLLFLLALLHGCEEAPPKAVVFTAPQYKWGTVQGRTITLRGSKDDLNRSYMRKGLSRYEQLTGNTVQLEMFSHEELATNLPAAFVAGTIPAPDIVLSYGGTNIESLNPEKNFYDFTTAPWVDDLTDSALNHTIYKGKVVGLTFNEASVAGILYNKKIFARLGLELPTTQAEFLEICEQLQQKGITPVYLPFAEKTMLLYQLPLDSIVADSEVLEQLNKGELHYKDIPQMKAIVSWYKTMADQGYFGTDYTVNAWSGMDPAMRSGEYAMMICWDTWLYTDFTGNATDFGIMPAFMGTPDKGSFGGPNFTLLLVNKNSDQLDAALDLITFLSDPYNYNEAFKNIYTAPAFKNQIGSISTPQYMAAERRIENHFYDSVAWLRIRGFSQLDAQYIQRHMRDPSYSVEDCLNDMDAARLRRAAQMTSTE